MSQPCALYGQKGHAFKLRTHEDLLLEEARALLSYDGGTGIFRWLNPRGRANADCPAGNINNYGYRRIGIHGLHFYAHRLAWFMHYEVWPDDILDHINRDRDDNRIANLRPATRQTNMLNSGARASASGFRGVYRPKHLEKWTARIKVKGKYFYLGSFDTPELAYAAYVEAAHEHHGEFASFGGRKRHPSPSTPQGAQA